MDDERAPRGHLDPDEDRAAAADAASEHTIGAALRLAEKRLDDAEIPGARIEATLLLGHVLGHSRAQLVASLSDPLTAAQASELDDLVERRLAHEPLQYIRGLAPFLDFELEVHPGVFIPRPETEGLVERALELWDPGNGGWAVDVGVGSGAISIALARAQPNGRVLAVDRSTTALDAALANAERLGIRSRIAFVRGNFLRALDLGPDDIGIIVANPPYAAADDEVAREVREHEPPEAWTSGPTGLEAYERIIPEAANLLLPGRSLTLELGFDQEDPVRGIIAADGRWLEPRVDPDYRDIPRILSVERARDV